MDNQKYDLTFPQKNIWLTDRFEQNSTINNILGMLTIKKDFDAEICREVINDVIRINDAMRLRVFLEEEKPVQIVKQYEYEKVEVVKMSQYSQHQKNEYLDGMSLRPLILLNEKLYEFKVLDYEDGSGSIVLKIHHMIADAWSGSKIGNQLIHFYEQRLKNISFEEIQEPSYIEYIEKEKQYQSSDKWEKDEMFWREYLNEVKEPVSLKPIPKNISNSGERYTAIIKREENNKITAFCKDHHISPYVLFLTILSIYITRVKDSNDFILGTPVLNRSNFREKQMLGMFVSTMPIRIQIPDEKISCIELARQIASNTMTLFRHQKYPYAKILEYIHKTTDIKTNLYHIALSYQNAKTEYENAENYQTDWFFSKQLNDSLQIHLMDIDDTGDLTIHYDYLKDIFNKTEIMRLHHSIMYMIQEVMENPNYLINNIEIITEEDKNKILHDFHPNHVKLPDNTTIIDLWEEHVKKNPDNIAVIFEDQKMTYRTLNEKANALAYYLREKKAIKPNDVVALILDRSLYTLIAILGVLKAGAAYLPIDPEFPIDRINYMLKNSNSKLAIVDKKRKIYSNKITMYINRFHFDEYPTNNISKVNKISDMIYIIYTSGTTGRPKGVMVNHFNVVNLIYAANQLQQLEKCLVWGCFSTYSFDISILETLLPLSLGKTVILANGEEQKMPEQMIALVKKYQIEVINMTPTRFRLLMEYDTQDSLRSLKRIMLGGEVFPEELFDEIKTRTNADIYDGYGPTEITVWSSAKKITCKNEINIGKSLANVTSYIMDSNMKMLPIGSVGELCIGGNGVAMGYYNNSKMTKSKFVLVNGERIYKTGDLAYYNEQGDLIYVGRLDSQIKLKGLRIEIEEIENTIKKIEEIGQCVVKVNDNTQLCAYFTASKNIDTLYLRNTLKKVLPSYMVPQFYMQVEKFEITTLGKVNTSYLPEVRLCNTEFVAPVTELEQELVRMWKRELQIENIGITDEFMQLGGDSLSAIKIATMISQKYHIALSPKAIFESQTITALEEEIKKAKTRQFDRMPGKRKLYPLSDSQKGIFAGYYINPDSVAYNIPFEIKFDKTTNVSRLKSALQRVVEKNEVFHSVIRLEQDKMFQKIVEDLVIEIPTYKMTEYAYELNKKKFVKPFDLLKGPLCSFEIIQTKECVYLLVNIHHIIFDGESMVIFLKQLQQEYEAKVEKEDTLCFGQFVLLNENLEQEPQYLEAKRYFLEKFQGELPDNSLPLDKSRESVRSFKGSKVKLKLTKPMTKKLKEYAKQHNVTVNSVMFSMFHIVLAKYMYSEDIILGFATSGRERKEELETIGMFVKTLPYRALIDYNETTIDYIKKTQKEMLEVIDYSIFPYEKLVKELNIERNSSRNPLFDVMYVYQNEANVDIEKNSLYGEINELKTGTSKFDLTCDIIPNEDNISINIEYATTLFERENIVRFGKNYLNAIKYILNNIECMLSDIQIISEKEKNKILYDFNNNKTEYPFNRTIHKLFEEQVVLHPDKIAVVFEDTKLTYQELNEKANQLSYYLIEKGIVSGDIVALMIDKSVEYLIGALAILKANAAYVAVIEDLPDERAKYMIENANAKMILTTLKFDRGLTNLERHYIDLGEEIYKSSNVQNPNLPEQADSLLHVIYTSGSTGTPKGNMIKHRGMVRLLLNTNYVDYTQEDIMVTSGSLTFDTSGFEVWGAMLYGMTLHMLAKENILNPQVYRQYLKKNNITTTFLPTPIFHQMVDADYTMFENLHSIYVGGDVLLPKYTNILYKKLPRVKVYNAYGPAEITVICCAQLIDREYKRDIPLGKIASNNTVVILDKCQNLCPINVPGELYVAGDGLGFGYINRDDLTKEKFIHVKDSKALVYRSGDLTLWNKEGAVRYICRIDSQLKIRGQRVEISEIQNRMLKLKELKEVALKVCTSNIGTQYLIAYYTENQGIDKIRIKNYLKKHLPVYMIPYKFIKVEKMPLNQNGKINKALLPEVELNENISLLPPENEKQELILNVFKTVLQNDNIGMNSDFFENGGDSLLVVKLLSELSIHDIKLTYSDIFKYKTPFDIYDLEFKQEEKSSISSGIENFEYSKINEILQNNQLGDHKLKIRKKIGNVLLTGVTGFLGVHVLNSLIDAGVERVYCLVREKNGVDVNTRIQQQLQFFFDAEKAFKIYKKIIIVDGDLTKDNIFNNNLFIEHIINDIDIVINCAACVKHYGDINKFYNINVRGTENLVRFCVEHKKELIHISTLSVSGNIMEGGQVIQKAIKGNLSYDETKFYVDQDLDNVYAYTKFLAEKSVFDAIVKDGLQAKVMRMGNLTGRYIDGKFQPNVEENAFSNRIKTMVELHMMPQNLLDLYLEMTPIDYAADAIVKLIHVRNNFNVFHLFNDNHAMMRFVMEMFHKINIDLEVKTIEETRNIIQENLNDPLKYNRINGIIADIGEDGTLKYNTNILICSDFTKTVLDALDFHWPLVTEDYFIKYLEYLKQIKFIDY